MKELELYDIYNTWHVPFWQTKLFLSALIGLCAALIILVLYVLYRKYKKNRSVPIAEQLLAQLNTMRSLIINSTDDAQMAYSTITDVLKAYFQHYYAKPFKTFTDAQMEQALASEFPLEYREALKKLLEDGVHVKFAREQALQQQLHAHVELSITIINHLEKARKSS
jgi:hypothetical protein